MPARFDLIVLDLDGTLVDSEALLVGLVNETLAAHGVPRADPRAVATTIGLPLAEVFRRATPGADDDAIARLSAWYRQHADAMEFVRQFRLYPNVAETLAQLRADGTRLVVGTSKGRATTLDIIAHCAIQEHIDDVIGGDCVTRGKPHPEMVEQARSRFGAPPERTLMVGDTAFDITMGQAAGAATCAVSYGMHSPESLRALRPDFVIDQFAMLRAVVAGRT
ncbi:MAG TPA: HAD-IA family hydrolase [Candidatus Kryptonia bacterium]|nr:HAD-IA family hydrolase [Candidatus Kryptonia bacterium]